MPTRQHAFESLCEELVQKCVKWNEGGMCGCEVFKAMTRMEKKMQQMLHEFYTYKGVWLLGRGDPSGRSYLEKVMEAEKLVRIELIINRC